MFCGIDLGGTAIKGGIVDARECVRAAQEISTPRGVGATIDAIAQLVRQMELRAGRRSEAVGVGVPGPLDARRQVVPHAPNLPGWRRVPVARILRRALGRPVFVENDANCAALAEALHGAGRTMRSLVLLTLGTGVGGGIVLNGRLWIGRGGAGELGHLPVVPDGRPCPCGNRGCLERYASATALTARYRALTRRETTAVALFAQRDAGACRVIEELTNYLAMAVVAIAHTLAPEVIAIGGGMARSARRFLPQVRRIAFARIFPSCRPLRIVPAALGNDAGWRGAAALARRPEARS